MRDGRFLTCIAGRWRAAQVGVIAEQFARGGDFECRNDAGTQGVEITQ
jgi:hypothetical protein